MSRYQGFMGLLLNKNQTGSQMGLKKIMLFYQLICYSIYHLHITTQDRGQLKTLLTMDECGSKIARKSDFDCPLPLIWETNGN